MSRRMVEPQDHIRQTHALLESAKRAILFLQDIFILVRDYSKHSQPYLETEAKRLNKHLSRTIDESCGAATDL